MLLPLLLFMACDPLPVVSVPQPPPVADAPPPAVEEGDGQNAAPADSNRAPVILGIDLQPPAPKTGDDVVASVKTVDGDGDFVRVELFWSINGAELPGRIDTTLPHEEFEKGDEIRLRVEATDREATVGGHSPSLVVRNTPPEITNKAGTLRKVDGFAIIAADVDDDPLTFRLQGAPAGMTIDANGVLHYKGSEQEKGGDYQVQVVVEDGGGNARWSFGLSVKPGSQAAVATEGAEAEKRPQRRTPLPTHEEKPAEDEDEFGE